MLVKSLKKILGSRNERVLKRLQRQVKQINELASTYQALSDTQLGAQTDVLRERLRTGESVDDILPDAFAVVREASTRKLGLRHFDVQLIGGMILHEGKIAEMRTGEGKTLVATLPAYLNALSGQGVHIVTVNDYLAKRDSQWMAPIYESLGLSVGVVTANMSRDSKIAAYTADITYGTNNEFGFDYLRDNMAFALADKVQRPLHYAIIDEVDSILIDEARTPLIISGPAEDSSELYRQINQIIPTLHKQASEEQEGDFTVDEKHRQVHLTEQGHQRVETMLQSMQLIHSGTSLYHPSNISLVHHLNAALRAHQLYHRDVDYIVQNNRVVIVDEHTGRTMPGRRWSEGLHQAIEAKESVAIERENQTLASITFQNYFRTYQKLSGMTGTADTEAYEFQQIYGLEVLVIPTNKPMIRDDQADIIYLTKQEKYQAIIEDVQQCQARGQPVLVGTVSIETSDLISKLLTKASIGHQVLNAKFHEKEAQIIAQAGQPGAVTIATNMAGRGTDIVLGGQLDLELAELDDGADRAAHRQAWQARHQTVLQAGGLRIIGSERHESRRIDNQLRGRSGRQGDPGSSRFYLSLDDDLMRIFASERMAMIMKKLGMKPGESIEHPWITKAIENAQRKVEGHNFDIRKQLLEYDNVANDQRRVIYQQRDELLTSDSIKENIDDICHDVVQQLIDRYIAPDSLEEQWDIAGLTQQLSGEFGAEYSIADWLEQDDRLDEQGLRTRIQVEIAEQIESKATLVGEEQIRHLEKMIMLRSLDTHWRAHLAAMDHLRQGIHLRGYAQKDPKQEYKREAFNLFTAMLDAIKYDVIHTLCMVQLEAQDDVAAMAHEQQVAANRQVMEFNHQAPPAQLSGESSNPQPENLTVVRSEPKVRRNEPCPCGSGKKYKTCHGKLV